MASRLSKNQIQSCFDQGAHSYENVCHVQHQSSLHLIHLLRKNWPHFIPKKILDIGTGTGAVVSSLLKLYPQAHFTLNDLSHIMLQQTQRKFSNHLNICYQQGDAENLEFKFHNLMISNFTFQWFTHLSETLHRFMCNSQILAFTTLTQDTFSTWRALNQKFGHADPTFAFPSVSSLKKICEDLNPLHSVFDTRTYTLTFPTPLAFAKYLKELGAHSTPRPFSLALLNLMKNVPKEITIHYHVFFALLQTSNRH